MTRSKLMMAGMLTLVLGLFATLPATASAQGWWGTDQDDRRDERRERREAKRDRKRERREERRERRDDRRDDRYDDGVWNQGRYGGSDRWENRRNQGRNGSYDNYPDYGGDHNARQTALNAGYNGGMREGREDRQRGDRFDYRDERDYQNATKDYNSRYGDRGTYQRYFREAFARGYNDGYRGY